MVVLFTVGLLTPGFPISAAEEATPLESIQIMTGNYRKGGGIGVIGHLGGVPVSIPKEFAYFVEYDGDPGFLEKRKGPIPKRTYESGICSFGFDIRYPDMMPVNAQTKKDKRQENIYTSMWMSVGVRSNSAYQDRSPARMANTLVIAWLKNASLFYRYEEQPEKVYGLTTYIPINADMSRREPGLYDIADRNIYVHRLTKENIDTYIECSNIKYDAASCQQRFGLGPALKASVDVRYRRALLPYWKEIQDGVTQVLLGFRVDPQKIQPNSSQSSSSLTQE
jgi:hypothetical protein